MTFLEICGVIFLSIAALISTLVALHSLPKRIKVFLIDLFTFWKPLTIKATPRLCRMILSSIVLGTHKEKVLIGKYWRFVLKARKVWSLDVD